MTVLQAAAVRCPGQQRRPDGPPYLRRPSPGLFLTVPFKTLDTKISDLVPSLTDIKSHGPLMWWPEHASTTCPRLFNTMRSPADAVAAVPSAVGRLPTTTQPPGKVVRAVVSPTFPTVDLGEGVTVPAPEISTILVPVPWRLVASLKLLISVLPVYQSADCLPYWGDPVGIQVAVGRHGGSHV